MELFLILSVAVAFLAETQLARRWVPAYCLGGLRVFRKECSVLNPGDALPRSESMELRFVETDLPTFDFRWITADRLAFRENYAGARTVYTQMMRGHLRFDRKTGTVEVVGMLNYFVLLFAAAFLGVAADSDGMEGLLFTVMGMLLLGACYLVQARRFDEVLSAAAAQWGRHAVEPAGAAGRG